MDHFEVEINSVSKAAILYRGGQLGMFTPDQLRAGYVHLKRRGEALEEHEDREMPVETPEVVTDGLTVLERDLGVPTAAVACQMRVQPRLLQDLLGVDEHGSGPSVVPLLRAGRPGDAATDGARAHRRSVVVVSGKAADIQLIKHVSDAVGELLGINQHSGRLTRSTSSLWVETARRMLSEVPTW